MRRSFVLAFVVSVFPASAFAGPLQITPEAYAAGQRADPGPTAERPAEAPRQRYAGVNQPTMGGGFLEFLFGGAGRPAPGQPPVQPLFPEYQADPRQQRTREAMPVYAPSIFGNMAHPPVDPKYDRQIVAYHGSEEPGTIVIDTPNRFLYLVQGSGKAIRYGIGVGRPGFTWSGVKTITAKREWPDWIPPEEMIQRRPDLPRYMAGGPENPLGARAMYLGSSLYRIHGSNEPWTIGSQVSSGCIRMRNDDVTDLYDRVKVGTKVIVL